MRMSASANTGTREPFVMENGPNFEEDTLKTCVLEKKEVHPPKRGCTSDKIYFPEEGKRTSSDSISRDMVSNRPRMGSRWGQFFSHRPQRMQSEAFPWVWARLA